MLGDGKQAELWVCFNPSFCQDRQSRVVDEVSSVLSFKIDSEHPSTRHHVMLKSFTFSEITQMFVFFFYIIISILT